VCHGDPSPCNCLFVDGVPSAFIDFDAAHPGRRQDDLAYAAWLWLDIGEQDLDPVSQGRRLGRFFTAYGCQSDIDPVQAVLAAQLELANRPSAPPSTKAWAKSCRAWAEQSKSALLDGVAETAV
jgi:Ser/Thr protein kinase RdoA (MazF antagonist)